MLFAALINEVKVMKFGNICGVFALFLALNVYGQEDAVTKSISQYPEDQIKVDEFGQRYVYDKKLKAKVYEINGETVLVLDELVLGNKPRFNNELDRNYYYFLNKKLNRVYPLFYQALVNYLSIQKELENIPAENRKNYIKEKQNQLANQYEAQLRDLTTTEGQIFAKLMHRATNKTVYDIIKELRGGWSAFWWNLKGNMVDVKLKSEYDPHKDRTDEFIENLLQSNWSVGYLKPYPGFENFKKR